MGLFLDWLIDDRPEQGQVILVPGSAELAEESPAKGTLHMFCNRYGVNYHTARKWKYLPHIQASYQEAVMREVRDPTIMLDVIREVRRTAMGQDETARASDKLKAAELYAKMVGYIAPEVKSATKPLTEMTQEELEAEAAKKKALPVTPVSVVTG